MEPLLILTTVPDLASAEKLAHALIEERAAACVNILAPGQSIYRWQDRVEKAVECPLMIKTIAANYTRVEKIVCTLHPYEVPELIAIPISHGLPAYLDWVATETENT